MKNKKQIKTEIKNSKNVFQTMRLMGHNKKLENELQKEFIKMVKDAQFTIKYSLNDKEDETPKYDRIKETEINDYLDAFKVYCDMVKLLEDL